MYTIEEFEALALYVAELEEKLKRAEDQLAYRTYQSGLSVEQVIAGRSDPQGERNRAPDQQTAYFRIWGADKFRAVWGFDFEGADQ